MPALRRRPRIMSPHFLIPVAPVKVAPGQSTSTDVLCSRSRARRSPQPACTGKHYRINCPPDSPIGLAALKSTATRSTRICIFLLPLVLPSLLRGHPGNRSRKLPRSRKKDRRVRGIGQHRQHRLGQRKGAGRILETTGSTSDLESHRTAGLPNGEIYAIGSLREIDAQ